MGETDLAMESGRWQASTLVLPVAGNAELWTCCYEDLLQFCTDMNLTVWFSPSCAISGLQVTSKLIFNVQLQKMFQMESQTPKHQQVVKVLVLQGLFA